MALSFGARYYLGENNVRRPKLLKLHRLKTEGIAFSSA